MEYFLTFLGYLNPFKIIEYINRPKLEIYFDANETYHIRRDMAFNETLSNWGQVMVRNNGKKTAKNCVGRLQSLEILKDNKFQAVPEYMNIVTLKWSHENNFNPKDVDPGYPVRSDLCYVHENYDILHFATEKHPSGSQTDFPPGTYKVKIKINCDNSKSVEKEFVVKLNSGNFKSLEISNIKI